MAPQGSMIISIIGDDAGVQAMLNRLNTALNPAAIATFLGAQIGPYIRERAQQRFKGEGDDVVGRWSPLKQATQAIRESQGFGAAHPINRRMGELEEYITHSRDAIAVHALGATMTYPGQRPQGELKEKVTTAQMGRTKPKTVPRPVLGMNERDLEYILTALAFHIQGRSV